MIAWTGCEKLEHDSADCVWPHQRNSLFFDSIKPMAKCEIGQDVSLDVKLLNIKTK